MNSKAYKEFNKFLVQLEPTGHATRIAASLKFNAYMELISNWRVLDTTEMTSKLDNEAQLFFVLLILEASAS